MKMQTTVLNSLGKIRLVKLNVKSMTKHKMHDKVPFVNEAGGAKDSPYLVATQGPVDDSARVSMREELELIRQYQKLDDKFMFGDSRNINLFSELAWQTSIEPVGQTTVFLGEGSSLISPDKIESSNYDEPLLVACNTQMQINEGEQLAMDEGNIQSHF
ncbi:hypothetical protein VNO78_00960 [Psophocarpus tetragonolobus]|uniref:Uncharacterized protein n=1 Tax=Psophocarpus tetragonolobus TaxID=3891 RepID=A0AAN9T132_PSOTE